MENYVNLDNKKIIKKSRVNYIKIVIVVAFDYRIMGSFFSLFSDSSVILFISMKSSYSNNTSTSLFYAGFSKTTQG